MLATDQRSLPSNHVLPSVWAVVRCHRLTWNVVVVSWPLATSLAVIRHVPGGSFNANRICSFAVPPVARTLRQ